MPRVLREMKKEDVDGLLGTTGPGNTQRQSPVAMPYAPYGLLVCAVRYALGRRSYVVSEVCGYVRGAIPSLKPGEREVIARDIRAELHSADGGGDDCDRAEWVSLLDGLERDVF